MIIFINDNSTIRSKRRRRHVGVGASETPKGTTALKEYSTTQQRKCALLKLHTRIYKTHQPTHTTHTHARNQHTRLVGRSDYRPRLGVLRCMGGSGARRWGFLIATAPQQSKGARREVLGYKWV